MSTLSTAKSEYAMLTKLLQFLAALFSPSDAKQTPAPAPEPPVETIPPAVEPPLEPAPEMVAPEPEPAEDTTMDLNSIIAKYAAEYGLPEELVKAVIQIESSGNTWAARYEPGYYSRYIAGKGRAVPSGVSRDTEEHSQATSYGLMQVMGGTARDEGFKGKFLTELCDPNVGVQLGCKHLNTHAKKFTKAAGHGWDSVLAAYNGGQGAVKAPGTFTDATSNYVNKVKAAMGGKLPPR